jgi:hypothetical protein
MSCPYCEHDHPTVAYDEHWGYICDPCKLRKDVKPTQTRVTGYTGDLVLDVPRPQRD